MARATGQESRNRVSNLAVFDCMLFLRACSQPKRDPRIFQFVRTGKVQLCLSAEVLTEIRDVLTRPKLIARFPALTPDAVDAFLAEQLRMARWIADVPEHFVLTRDPKDSKYLNLAIAANANHVVSTDFDLLDLMTSQDAEAVKFRTHYPTIYVVNPAEFEAIVTTIRP
jgi:putative PIN family toxin of toxin-antitoxin system